jgi:demethylmenaquinone methyltransferase/2-methoxy-6-polyprenyl-1,4-benzoquinol methylase
VYRSIPSHAVIDPGVTDSGPSDPSSEYLDYMRHPLEPPGEMVDHDQDGVYDWWSRHPRLLDAFYAVVFAGREASIRRRALEALALSPGDRVLELGSGPGNGLARLRARVGPTGAVVGVDASAGMVRRAADRVREAGWENVHVLRGDATRLPVADGSFDAVYAAMSLSAMPDPLAAVDAAHDALRVDGRLAVLDARPFQEFPLTLLNRVLVPLFEATTNWVPDVDIVGGIGERFEDVRTDAFTDGTLFVAAGRRGA